MEFKDWISVIAIIASPLIAVWVTMRVEAYRQRRREQMELFKTLMSQRGLSASYAWLNALNSIPVIFHDDTNVLSALNLFLQATSVSSAGVNELVEIENKRIKLLEIMADSLGYNTIDWEQIKSAYTPQWVAQELEFNTKMRDAQLAFAKWLSTQQASNEGLAVNMAHNEKDV